MEGNTFTRRGVEVQPVHDGNVYQIVRGQAPISFRFEVVRSIIASPTSCRCQKLSCLRIIATIGQELKHEEWMGSAALPEVDLDRDVAPDVTLFHRYEIETELTTYALARQCLGNLCTPRLNLRAVTLVGGKTAA